MIIDKNLRIKIREKYKMNFLMMFRFWKIKKVLMVVNY